MIYSRHKQGDRNMLYQIHHNLRKILYVYHFWLVLKTYIRFIISESCWLDSFPCLRIKQICYLA